jgi:dienelactone hydrolase
MRAKWLICCLALGLAMLVTARTNGADEDAKTLPAGEMLKRYLLDQARQQFTARRQAIAAIKTPEDVARRQKAMRSFLLRSLGDLPERTPLDPTVVGSLTREGYRVEKVIFESRPNHHVTANLYLPAGKPPFPGVLLPCGHSDNGKAYEGYQRACILLAKNGMAVLCYDPIGQGERLQLLDAHGKPVVRNTTEHTMEGIGALLVGRQLASYRIWDGFRAMDYLESRPEVDPDRLGCTGNSGGGTLTAYLMALDDRIKVAAPSCFITSVERLFATIGPQDAEQNITGDVAAGLEHADYVTIRAPKPTLLTVGTRDFFDIQGSWDTFREVKLIFGRLGFGERVDLFESDEEHGFTRPRRVATVRWMKRWLLKHDEAVDEPENAITTDAELQCTRTGQVLLDFKDDVSVFDLNRDRERALRVARESANQRRSNSEFRDRVRKLIGLKDRKLQPVKPRVVARTLEGGFTVRELVFEVEPGMFLPALDVTREGRAPRAPTVVKIGVAWKEALLRQPGTTLEKLTAAGGRTVLFDPRGLGETSPSEARERSSPFGVDWKESYMAIRLDRPLLGQRVSDLLQAIGGLDAESAEDGHHGFELFGVGAAGPVVLHAALLDERGLITNVTLEWSLVSWADIVQKGVSRNQMGNVVPGALEEYDLPDLVARLGPNRVSIHAAVDASGEPVSRDRPQQ